MPNRFLSGVRTIVLIVPSLFAAAALGAVAAVDAAPDQVEVADGELTLQAILYKPDGAGPFPAIVALHDCGGLTHRPAMLEQLYADWATHLVAQGFVVLFPDSFGSRGLGNQCSLRERKVRASRQRVADANAARRWLQGQSYVQADHVALLGWGDGALTALWAVRPNGQPRDGSADFRSAVAFYPFCHRLRETAWSARVPVLILIGSADDWTSAGVCQQMVAGAHGRSAHVQIVVYPDAHHDFDRADMPLHLRTGLAFTPDPSGKAHGGTNPAARNDALKRVPQWLAR